MDRERKGSWRPRLAQVFSCCGVTGPCLITRGRSVLWRGGGKGGELGQGWCWQPYWLDSLLGSTRIPFLKLISEGHSLRGTGAGGGESRLSWAVAFHLTCRMAGLSLTQDVAGNISTWLRWEMSKEQEFCSFPFCSSCPHGRGSEMSWKENRLWIQKSDSVIYHPNCLFPVYKKELRCQQYL